MVNEKGLGILNLDIFVDGRHIDALKTEKTKFMIF